MGSRPFTDARVAEFKCEAGRDYTLKWDPKQPGLGVRITAQGTRTYIFERRLKNGRTCRVKIGRVAGWKVGQARERARELAVLVDKGRDPRIEAAAERTQEDARRIEDQRSKLVLEGVWQSYVEDRKTTWGDRHHRNHLKLSQAGGERRKRGKGLTTPGPLASLMALKLSELTGDRIAVWLKREASRRPTNAAQSYRLLRAFIRWASEVPAYKGAILADAYTARAVRDVLPKSRAKDGDCLQREQLPAWFRAVRALPNPVISAYLQTLLLTGARREELATLRRKDVVTGGQWDSMTIRDKVEGQRTIPLTPYVASLLATLPRRNEWQFSSSEAKGGRLVEPRIAHNRALAAAGLPHVTLHGLRRSFGTLAEWVEIPTGIVAQLQGHKPSAIAEKHYRRRPLDLLRVWHAKLEAWILEQAEVSFVPPKAAGKLTVVKARA